MLNKVILTGRLTATPELKTTTGGISVTTFSIAVQRQYKSADGSYPTDFINIVAWRSTAEFITRFFEKGQLIAIVGSIQTRNYEDKTGAKRQPLRLLRTRRSLSSQSVNLPLLRRVLSVSLRLPRRQAAIR